MFSCLASSAVRSRAVESSAYEETLLDTSNKGSYCGLSSRKLSSHSQHLFAFKSAVAGAHRRVSACNFPICGVFPSCFHPVPANDLVAQEHLGVVFAFSAACSLSFCRNFLSSGAQLFSAVVSGCPIPSCLVRALPEGKPSSSTRRISPVH
jgi:hypothetical protein